MYIYIYKAFDTVKHSILLDKLFNYGIRGLAHDWFKRYLANRNQFVLINGSKSDLMKLNMGVPEGSVSGWVCFYLYSGYLA